MASVPKAGQSRQSMGWCLPQVDVDWVLLLLNAKKHQTATPEPRSSSGSGTGGAWRPAQHNKATGMEFAQMHDAGNDDDLVDSPLPREYAGDALFESVYQRLKQMAGNQLARKGGSDSMNTTGLVHELYLRMSTGASRRFVDPAQFFDYAAKAMRHIVVDRARARMRTKRGGGLIQVDLQTETTSLADTTAQQALEIDEGLRKLESQAPRAARIVELHFFAGLSLPQVAEQLDISTRTVNREWRFARAFLHGDPG